MPLSMQEMARRRALDEIEPSQHLLRLFGSDAWSISQKRQRTPAGLSFAIEPGMMDVPRPHASLLRAARIVRDFSREMTSPACSSAMPRAAPPEMESSGACAACSFMPSAEGMKGILRLRMTARAKMAKASEGDRPISRHVSVNSLSRSSSLSTDMPVRNPISGRCIYRTHRWHLSNVSFAGCGRAEELLCQPYRQ